MQPGTLTARQVTTVEQADRSKDLSLLLRTGGSALAIRAVVRHGVEAIGHGSDRRGLGNLVGLQAAGVATAVPALVVAARDIGGEIEAVASREELAAPHRVLLHHHPFIGAQG